jgi:oligopeptide/dipeptide ABC transporter ATP-binding protein
VSGTAGALLEVEDLTISIRGAAEPLVDGARFSVGRGEILCVVGESGCGKSLTALALMGLLPDPPLRRVAGTARLEGRDLFRLPAEDLRLLRGGSMAMIFQEPMTSLNPSLRVGAQIAEAVRAHGGTDPEARAVEMLARVGIPAPEARARAHPHELSGGMRQRAMIAMALANDPALLIADEPTTALDVTVQAQVLDLMRDLVAETGAGLILITHDLGVVAEMADRVAVMYAGRIVEAGPVRAVFEDPQHPYTLGLMRAMPSLAGDGARLHSVSGSVPPADAMPRGCRFAPRCPFAAPACAEVPPLAPLDGGHAVACWRAPLERHVVPEAVA